MQRTMQLDDAAKKLADPDPAVRDAATAAIAAAKERAVPYLVAALSTSSAAVPKIALFLAALEAHQAVPALSALVDKGVLDVDARAAVARALAELCDARFATDEGVKRALRALARDPSPLSRKSAVKALSAVGDVDSVALVKQMAFSEQHLDVKQALLEELRAITAREEAQRVLLGGATRSTTTRPAAATHDDHAHLDGAVSFDIAAALDAHKSTPSAAAAAVADDVPDGPYHHLLVKLKDPRWARRSEAVDELVAVGKPAVRDLIDALERPHVGARLGACLALARIQAPEAAPALLRTALEAPRRSAARSDEERELRPIALKALANALTGAEEGMASQLLPLAKDDDAFVRAGALLCLGRLADRVAAKVATLALLDPHDHVREAAAVALSESAREEHVDLVLPLLAVHAQASSAAIKEAILVALSRIHIEASTASGAVDPAAPPALRDAPTLVRLRHRVRKSVLGVTAAERRTALAIVERCYSEADPPPLLLLDDVVSRLEDEHPEVRVLAAAFLARFLEPGMTRAVPALEDALAREERTLSLLSLEALRRHDTPEAKAALTRAIDEDPDEAVQQRAKELLEGFAPTSQEWRPSAPAARSPAPPAAPPGAAPSTSRRKKVASGEVVEAKDAPPPKRLKERLEELQARGLSPEELARAREELLQSF